MSRFKLHGICTALLCVACNAPKNPTEVTRVPAEIQQHVTGEVSSRIGPDGRFLLNPPRAPDDIPIITEERARELATAFLRTWGHSHAEVWRLQRGAPLDIGSLRLADEVYFAATPHGRLPDGFHGAYRRMIGPWYILHFTSNDQPVLGLAISAYSTDLEIRDGLIHQPPEGGTYFMARAVADGPSARWPYVPVTPEQAVERIGLATGAKVTAVPELVLRNAAWHPLFAQWRLALDRSVHVEQKRTPGNSAPGERKSVAALFMGPGNSLFSPAREQPASTPFAVTTAAGVLGDPVFVNIGRRGQMAVMYDEVSLLAEQR